MMNEDELFLAGQDEIMSRPQEDFGHYLARRQSRTSSSPSYTTHPQLIAAGRNLTPECEPAHAIPKEATSSPARHTAQDAGVRLQPQDPPAAERPRDVSRDARTSSKRKPDTPGDFLDQRPEKRPKGAPEPPASGRSRPAAPDRHAVAQRPGPSGAVSVDRELGIPTHAQDALMAAPQAALAATEPRALPSKHAPKEASGAPARVRPLMSSADIGEGGLEVSSRVMRSERGRDLTAVNETRMSSARALGSSEARTEASGSRVRVPQDPTASKRTARTKPFEVPQGVKHHAPIADSSNITSPTSTAPGVANPATAKGAVEKKGKVTVVAKQATAKRGATSAQKPKGKGKRRELITASEYAKMKNAEAEERRLNGRMPAAKQFLEGKRIFYYGADLNYAGEDTQRRMDIIIKHGGTLIPDYDPDQITHIVVSKNTGAKALLKVIGLRRLKDIPQRIPTVTWDWIQTGFSAPRVRASTLSGKEKAPDRNSRKDRIDVADEDDPLVYKMGWLFEYAAYSERIDAGETPWGEYMAGRKNLSTVEGPSGVNGGRSTDVFPTSDVVDDSSHISDFTQDKVLPGDGVQIMPYAGLPSPPSSPSYPSLGTLLPHYTKVAGKVVQAVQSISGNGGSWQDTAVHAENHVVDPAMRYAEDPLAEFYAQARAERNAEMFGHDESDSESITPEKEQISRTRHRKREAVKKGVFICDDKGGKRRQATCPNQDVIDKLEELKALHDVKPGEDDRWRVYGLNKAIAALRRCPTRIRTLEEAMKLNGVGEKTARKIIEIIQTGDLMRIQYETTEDIKAVKEFTGIYGVGANTARTWFNNGCRTLEDIAARKGGVKLSHAQEIGLRYYRDINTRIPRAEVQEIYDKIKGEALKLDPKLFIQVMGSFRRGKSTCGDIDILISRPVDDGKTHQGILRRLLAELHRQDIVTEDLCLPDNFEDLELVYRGLCRKGPGSLRRRIDFLTVPWVSRGAALLYYTGDDIFNRSLRLKANKMGYSLNQRGLYADVIRNKDRQKVTEGVLVASESEREILDILGVPWQEPHERVRH